MQENCWLVAESSLEKQIQSSAQRYRTPSKLQNEIKNFIVVLLFIIVLFEKIDKNFQFNSLFLGNFQNFYLFPGKADGFFIWGYQGLRFRAWPIYTGFTIHCLMIICKYLNLSHKRDYQRNGLNTYEFVSLFQWFK